MRIVALEPQDTRMSALRVIVIPGRTLRETKRFAAGTTGRIGAILCEPAIKQFPLTGCYEDAEDA